METEYEFDYRKTCFDSEETCGCFAGCTAFLEKYLKGDEERLGEFKDSFLKQYKSVSCGSLRPAGIRESDPVHICAALLLDTVLFTYRFLTAEK